MWYLALFMISIQDFELFFFESVLIMMFTLVKVVYSDLFVGGLLSCWCFVFVTYNV